MDADFDLDEFFNLSYFEDVNAASPYEASFLQAETAHDVSGDKTSPQQQPNPHAGRRTGITNTLSSETPQRPQALGLGTNLWILRTSPRRFPIASL